ncbi:MAG: hypothetical protein ACRDPI_04055 [Nocardioidaceae bacterium]
MSALVDGQLDADATERAWAHVAHCPPCRAAVEREGWVKRQLSEMAIDGGFQPPAELVGSLHELDPTAEAWASVQEIERRGRGRRRAGLALVGAGSVSAAVFGLTTLGGPLVGGAGTPAASLSRAPHTAYPVRLDITPSGDVRGRLPGWTVEPQRSGAARATSIADHR